MIVRHLAKASGSALCDLHEKHNAFDGNIITCNTLLQYEDTSAFGILIILNTTKK